MKLAAQHMYQRILKVKANLWIFRGLSFLLFPRATVPFVFAFLGRIFLVPLLVQVAQQDVFLLSDYHLIGRRITGGDVN